MSTGQSEHEPNAEGTIFFSRTYDEAFMMVVEAREYLLGPGKIAVRKLPSEASFCYATESLRLTTRLTECMSWLMFQRAVTVGEITVDEVQADECHLQFQTTCLPEEQVSNIELLPPGLVSLLERSELLYRRIWRLDQLAIEKYKAG
jgi:regulator of CtrA degradation